MARVVLRIGADQIIIDPKPVPSIASTLHDETQRDYDHAIDGLESLILAHFCAGVDVESARYVEGIQTALDAISNHLV